MSSKAADESKPEAYPQGYVEDFDEPRTTLADFFSILLALGLCRRAWNWAGEFCWQLGLLVYAGCIELGLCQA